MADLFHSAFVYGAKFHPIREDGFLYIATICYDQKVRIWAANVQDLKAPIVSLECEMDINAQTENIYATKRSIYDAEDNLEDETLRLLMNPQDNDFS